MSSLSSVSETTPVSSCEHLGSSSGRRHAEHRSTGGSQLGNSGAECGGLASAGGTDDEDELLVAGDSGRCVGLGDVEIDVGEVDCCGLDVAAEGEAVFGPIEQIVFLVEDGLGRQGPIDGRLGDWATVGSQERIGWDGRGDVDAAADRDSIGEVVERVDDRRRVGSHVGREDSAELSLEFSWSPSGLSLAHRFDRTVDQHAGLVLIERTTRMHLPDGVGDDLVGRGTELHRLLAPLGVENGGVDVRLLAWACVEHGFSFELPPLPRCRVAVHRADEAVELGVDPAADVVGTARVLGEHDIGDVGHLGDAVLGCPPANAEVLGQLGSQAGVVERGEGALVALDESGVEGEPAAVG